jgi:hypothetical protein
MTLNFKFQALNLKGFSIAELLIIVGLFSIIIVILISVFLSQTQYFNNEQIKLLLSGYFDVAFGVMKNLIIASDSVLTSYNILGNVYTSDSQTLVLKLPSIDNDKKTIVGQYDYAAIFKSGNDLKILLSPSSQSSRKEENRSIAQNVASVNFDYQGVAPNLAKTILFSMTLSKTSQNGQTITITRSLQATLRNL